MILVESKYLNRDLKCFLDSLDVSFSTTYEEHVSVIIGSRGFVRRILSLGSLNLRKIILTSSGTDKIDLSFLSQNSIELFTARDVYSNSISEYIIYSLFGIYKRHANKPFNSDKLFFRTYPHLSELSGLKVALFGSGSIAMSVCKKLRNLVKQIDVISSSQRGDIQFNLGSDKNYKMLSNYDVIILATNYTEKKCGIINEDFFKYCRSNVTIISVARFEFFHSTDTYRFLRENRNAFIVQDLFEVIPGIRSRKLSLCKNFYAVPAVMARSNQVTQKLNDYIKQSLLNEK